MNGDRVCVFTFKDGLLSRVAHDLRLHVEHFTITREGDDIVGRFDAGSLVVDGVMHRERFDPGGLGARDRAKIAETIRDEILRTRVYPSIDFRGRLELDGERRVRVDGVLTLMGVRRPLLVTGTRDGTRVRASVSLRPSEFGIKPYKALAGAIRLQDRLRIELDLASIMLVSPDHA